MASGPQLDGLEDRRIKTTGRGTQPAVNGGEVRSALSSVGTAGLQRNGYRGRYARGDGRNATPSAARQEGKLTPAQAMERRRRQDSPVEVAALTDERIFVAIGQMPDGETSPHLWTKKTLPSKSLGHSTGSLEFYPHLI